MILSGVLTAVVACVEVAHYNAPIRLSLSISNSSQVSSTVDPPFVSVIDSMHLVVTPSSGGIAIIQGKHVQRSQNSIGFDVDLSPGTYNFSISVLSGNGLLLFRGDTTASVRPDQLTLNLLVSPRRPVMVVSPDTTTTSSDNGKVVIAHATIHNRGLDSLVWRFTSVPPVYAGASCQQTCIASPDSGRIAAGGSQALTFFVPNTFGAQVLCYILSSAEGDAPVCWRK